MPTLHPRQQQTPMSARIPPDIPSDPSISGALGTYLRNFALWARNGFAEQMRNNEALQGVMLRGYDTPAGSNPAVWMLEVTKAGILGLGRMALGSSADPGAFVPIGQGVYAPLLGVTNGSNAPAGHVGEYVSATPAAISLTNNVAANAVVMNLTAGDWDVEGLAQFSFASPYGSAVVGGVSTVSATFPGVQSGRSQVNLSSPVMSIWGLPTGTIRVNLAAAAPVYLVVLALMGGTGTAQGSLRARRSGNVG